VFEVNVWKSESPIKEAFYSNVHFWFRDMSKSTKKWLKKTKMEAYCKPMLNPTSESHSNVASGFVKCGKLNFACYKRGKTLANRIKDWWTIM